MANIKLISFETFGCSANLNNTEIMKGLVKQAGLEIVENPEIADIIVINSCIVKEPTEKEIERRILELKKLGKKIIVAGCMPEVREKKLNKFGVFSLGTHHTKDILKLIRKISEVSLNDKDKKEFLSQKNEEKLCSPKISQAKKIGITQILEGCLGSCNFCLTRFAKGKLFSYSQDKIIENIKQDLKNGCKEIWLTSQDNASYGLDRGKSELIELLNKILNIDGEFRIRLGMMNPNNVLLILNDLIEIYKNNKMYKYLHIPFQSASNKILKSMNRFYKIEDFNKIISNFKSQIPEITIATDIIVAYPQETEEDFKETLNLIEKIKPDVLNVSRYWPMKDTPASLLEQIPSKTSKERASIIMKLFLNQLKEKNSSLIGKQFNCLVYDSFKTNFLARTQNYKLVLIKSQKNILGKFVKVKITSSEQNHLLGEII